MQDYGSLIERAIAEIRAAAGGVESTAFAALVGELASAKRIVAYGVGREGLMMRALAMRLYHLGLDAHVAGDMSAPPVGSGDLLIVSAGPGDFGTVMALVDVARAAGARTVCVTAQPQAAVPRACDTILAIPAQTMADDQGSQPASVLPMGSLYEGAQYLVFEMLVLTLREKLGVSAESMRTRHTNLE